MQVTKGTWRMHEQCVPGSLSSSPTPEPGNEANHPPAWSRSMIVGKRDRLGSALYRGVGRSLQNRISRNGDQLERKPSKLIPVNNKGNNSKDSVLDSVTGTLPVYKAIGVGNHHL